MSLGEIAGFIAALAAVVLVALLAVPLLKLGRVLEELRLAVRDLGHNSVPILQELRGTVSLTNEEIEKLGTGKLRLAVVEGDTQWGSLMAGQSAGLVKKIEPAAAIIEDLINGATAEIERLKRFAD